MMHIIIKYYNATPWNEMCFQDKKGAPASQALTKGKIFESVINAIFEEFIHMKNESRVMYIEYFSK